MLAKPPEVLVCCGAFHEKEVPPTFDFNAICTGEPEQIVVSLAVITGLGFTFTKMVFSAPLQVLAVALMV